MADKADSVLYLKSHTEELSRRLQELLDRQWDGLSERKGRWIVSARDGIDRTMSELLETQTALVELYQAQISSRRAWLERTKHIQDKITALTTQINSIEKESELATEISTLEQEQSGINEEIAQLQFRLKQLYSRKQEIATRLNQLQSSVEAKTSSFRHELDESMIRKQQGERQAEVFSLEVDAIKDEQDAAEVEIVALRDGLEVWREVCSTITRLESSLRNGSVAGLDPDSVHTRLNEAAEKLTTSMQLAQSSNWSLLTVAISHELEALNEAIQLVTESTSQTSQKVIN